MVSEKEEAETALPPKPTPKSNGPKSARRQAFVSEAAHTSPASERPGHSPAVPQPAGLPAAALARAPAPAIVADLSMSEASASTAASPVATDAMVAPVSDLLDEEGDQQKCIVCWIEDRETTLAPCGHRVLCR